MLSRFLGLIVGLAMVSEGVYAAVNPQGWSKFVNQTSESMPEPVRSSCQEFSRLSDDSIRVLGACEAMIGWLMLKLVRR